MDTKYLNYSEEEIQCAISDLTKIYNNIYDDYYNLCDNPASIWIQANKFDIEYTSNKELVDKLLIHLQKQIEYIENEFSRETSFVPRHISDKLTDQRRCC